MKKIILASTSPSRKELFKRLGIKFKVVASDYEEKIDPNIKPKELVKKLSYDKAKSVADKSKNSVVIGVDSLGVFGKKLLGKPKDKKDAYKILIALNGKCHLFISGFTIIDSDSKKFTSKAVETEVCFKKLKPKEIKAYVDSGEPMGKGAAYAIQGLGAVLVKKIIGDYTNIMGLPIPELVESLKKFNVHILAK